MERGLDIITAVSWIQQDGCIVTNNGMMLTTVSQYLFLWSRCLSLLDSHANAHCMAHVLYKQISVIIVQ